MRDREMLIKLRVGIFVLSLLTLFVAFVLTIGIQTRLFEEQYLLRAAFRDVQGLLVGAPVRLAGLTVGTVRRINFEADPADPRIHVEVAVDRQYQPRIREDSVATIGTIGLVGDKVFDVTVGSAGARVLDAGQMLQAVEPVDFGRLVSRGGEVLEGLAGASQALQSILKKVEGDDASGGLVRDLTETVKSLRRITAQAEQGEGLLHALIFGEGGKALVGDLRGAVGGLHRVVERVQAGEGLAGALLSGPRGPEILEDLRVVVSDLKGITAALAEGEGTLGALLKDPTVYEDLSTLLRGAERNWILRGLIRSSVRGGRDAVQEGGK